VTLIVPDEARGARLDRWLASAMKAAGRAVSRAELQRWIEAGRVTVAGRARRAADRVAVGEAVVVVPEAPRMTEAVADAGVAFEILHADEDLVVVNKPAGLVVHPAAGHASGTLVNGLLARGLFDVRAFEGGGEIERLRPGIVHRLDRGTSGVMVVARTAAAREALRVQFAEHTIDRVYEAVCEGLVESRVIDTLHGRHPTDRVRFSSRVRVGKRAVTKVAAREAVCGATYVECTLRTGRTHQIRVHLADAGTPILGDPLYGRVPRDPSLRAVAAALGRQALHARVLGFTHPRSGERVLWDVEAPPDFVRLLEALRARRAKGEVEGASQPPRT
jgi:23S rRNA pseudouridine1911/1915/1917 synthase